MLHRNVENFIGCDSSYRTASIVLYGAPFDSTTSYRPGARFGPAAMRHESYGLETYSPYQDKDLEEYAVFDSGDLELCFGSSEMALQDIEERTATILQDGKLPFMVGGEHLVTLGAFRAVLKKYPYEISGGQKQRAAVARAIITNPRLLLADEPTGALDSKATDELLRVFSDISRSGQTILMVTHSVRAASRAGRVLFIKAGEV